MSRSVWKGPFSALKEGRSSLLNTLSTSVEEKISNPKTVWSRASIILPKHIGKRFKIHNGKGWVLRTAIESMVGHKFGEFSTTKKRVAHKLNKKRQVTRKK